MGTGSSNPRVQATGAGFVTKFAVQSDYLSQFSVQQVEAALHTEYWIPAEDLHTFNENIVGEIQVIREFRQPALALIGAGDGNRRYRSEAADLLKSRCYEIAESCVR
jgi:hypothetical protein